MSTLAGRAGLLVPVSCVNAASLTGLDAVTTVWGTFRSCCGDDSGNLEPGTKAGNGSLPGYVYSNCKNAPGILTTLSTAATTLFGLMVSGLKSQTL